MTYNLEEKNFLKWHIIWDRGSTLIKVINLVLEEIILFGLYIIFAS